MFSMQAEGHNPNIGIKDVKNVTDLGEARKNKDRKGQSLPSGSAASRTEDDLTRELLSLYDISCDYDGEGEGEGDK